MSVPLLSLLNIRMLQDGSNGFIYLLKNNKGSEQFSMITNRKNIHNERLRENHMLKEAIDFSLITWVYVVQLIGTGLVEFARITTR